MSTLIVIPARMKATRLPNKPMADIGGAPMIVQVWQRAIESKVGDVVVACDGEEIAAAVRSAGGEAVITDPNHPSGSDRIWEVVSKFGSADARGGKSPIAALPPRSHDGSGSRGPSALRTAQSYDIIINLQGDVPTLEPRLLKELLVPLVNPEVDIATLAAPITCAEEQENPSVVKAILALKNGEKSGRALYFTRCVAPYGEGVRYHHIGVYAYRRAALERFVSLPPSPLELREKLEQLRALEAGMRIDAVVVDTVPLGVDTPEDLERARELLQA
ncbi:MAG: 3-deoxy-manno-octulosonate cytidylyltransferase [Rickettsiales bacterium]